MYKLIEQSVTEARQLFTSTLKEMVVNEDQELVIIVRRHGKPVAGIISATELSQFFGWKKEQIRVQDNGSSAEDCEPAEQEETSESTQSTKEASMTLPEGWEAPNDYAHRYLAEGISPEAVFEGLKGNYCKYGLTREAADQIVVSIAEERGIEIG